MVVANDLDVLCVSRKDPRKQEGLQAAAVYCSVALVAKIHFILLCI